MPYFLKISSLQRKLCHIFLSYQATLNVDPVPARCTFELDQTVVGAIGREECTGGEVVKWGGTFWVPAAFVTDDLDAIIHSQSGADENIGDVDVQMIEVRE